MAQLLLLLLFMIMLHTYELLLIYGVLTGLILCAAAYIFFRGKRYKQDDILQALEAMPVGVAIGHFNGADHSDARFAFVNKTFCSIWDCDDGALCGKSMSAFFASHMDHDLFDEALSEDQTEWQKPDVDEGVWYGINSYVVNNKNDAPELFVIFQSDITDIKKQEDQFYQMQKMEALAQLAGGVAHDFNNILSIVDGYARMVQGRMEVDDPSFNYLGRINQATKRGASLTRQLLTFGSHQIAGEKVVNLRHLIGEQEALIAPLIDASIQLYVNCYEDLHIKCAPDGFVQVLINLVINARDSMPDGGSIIISAKQCEKNILPAIVPEEARQTDYARISVMDTGCGMDADTIANIFNPFYTTKERGKGTGLGLAMVFGIMRQMGGYIDVHSNVGQGTSMHLYIPLSDEREAEQPKVITGEKDEMRFDGYTVLVAEDEEDLLYVVSSMLEGLGMNVISAKNGNEALIQQDLHEGEIDLLLTDIVMPEVNGPKLAELMKSVRPECHVVYMSGYPSDGKLAKVTLPDDGPLLTKPVEYKELMDLIHSLLTQNKPAELGALLDNAATRWS